VGGLAAASANVIAEDPRSAALLFLGTDHGLFASIDAGAHWTRMQANMPAVPVRDVVIHPRENDLIVGTHGRGLFVTDIAPLQQLTEGVLGEDVYLFAPEPKGLRIESGWGNYRLFGHRQLTTPNEPNGVLIDVYRRVAGDSAALRLVDGAGATVRSLEVPAGAGLHRIVWNLRNEEDRTVEPGEYTVTLEAGRLRQSRPLRVLPPVVLPRH
jgi:hypothetical protein